MSNIYHIKTNFNNIHLNGLNELSNVDKTLIGKDRYKHLYHFTSFLTFKKIWKGKSLKFSDLTDVNDIMEASLSTASENLQQLPLLFAYQDLRKQYKQISFTMDYNKEYKGAMSPLMWGIYGDKREGVCIEFDYDKIPFPKGTLKDIVRYKSNVYKTIDIDTNLRTQKDINKFIIKNQKRLMFTKLKCWEYENEYRVLSNSLEYIDISQAIVAIYITDYRLKTFNELCRIVNGEVPIKMLSHTTDSNGYILPYLTDALQRKKQDTDAANNPKNAINTIFRQAKRHYEKYKHNVDADLIKSEYKLKI